MCRTENCASRTKTFPRAISLDTNGCGQEIRIRTGAVKSTSARVQIPESNNVQALNQLESVMRLRDDRVGQLMVDPLLDPAAQGVALWGDRTGIEVPSDLSTFGAQLI